MRNNFSHLIAFATCGDLGGLTADDQSAADLLGQKNVLVEPVSWDDPAIHWQDYEAVILRSTWNYHRQLPQFLQWLAHLDDANVRVWNPPDIVRSNVSKKYLIDLHNAGIPIVPTVWISSDEKPDLKDVLKKQQWSRVIIKPDVSASAYRTITATVLTASDDQQRLDEILKTSGALIQKFRNEIIETGEWSLIFIERAFSHAVLKHPRTGDFRVQEELGGIIHTEIPSESLIHQAQKILDQIHGPLLYARVDGIVAGHEFLLMELELIEPSLFMRFSPGAAERFANSIINIL